MTATLEAPTLGDYHVIKQIGQGSLGTVYLAEHRFIKRQYVLKVLPEELASDRGFVQRFESEVQRVAGLDHPNIAHVHNISQHQGKYFLVTDCIVDDLGETTNLAQYMAARGRRLDEEELVSLLKQIAAALDYAHSRHNGQEGLVHGGLKLNNVLIGQGPNGSYPVLTDFGLGQVVGVGTVLTRTFQVLAEAYGLDGLSADQFAAELDLEKLRPLHGSFLQSYAFLAPEQKRIDRLKEIGPATDSWAFGVLTYFLIAGEYPEGAFPLPSTFASGYARDWDTVVQRCLHPNPSQRPTSLEELLQETAQKKEAKVLPPTEKAAPTPARTAPVTEELKPVIRGSELETPTYEPDPLSSLQVDPSVKEYRPEVQRPTDVKPIQSEMVSIPGGNFIRGSREGSRDEEPPHQVTIPSFALDIHPVSNEQFVRFLVAMGGVKDQSNHDIILLRESRIKRSGGQWSIESGYGKHPVVGVTWYGAVAYAKWVGKRLPTEAEWEVAASAGIDANGYPTGGDIERSQANYFNTDSTPVMSYAPNALGLYDMAGNVYEWCHDWYQYDYYKESAQNPHNPKGPLQGVYRVLRGGCWKSLKEDLRCSHRHRNNPGTGNGTYGFRCAADVTE